MPKVTEKQQKKSTGPCKPKTWVKPGLRRRKATVSDKKYQKRCPQRNYVPNKKYGQFNGDAINQTDRLGNTALYYAVLHGNFDMVQCILEDPVADPNILGTEGMSPFMLTTVVKRRGNLPLFYSFLIQAEKRIDFQLLEDRSMKTSLKADKASKPNNIADYALMEEFVYVERPMTQELMKRGVHPTGGVAKLVLFEELREQDRMQSYRIDPEKPVQGTVSVSMKYDATLFDAYGGVRVNIECGGAAGRRAVRDHGQER